MAGGVWVLVVVPAVIAFLFAIWVATSVYQDVSKRDEIVYDPLQGAFRGEAPPGVK